MRTTTARSLVLASIVMLGLAACGDDDGGPDATGADGGTPTGGDVKVVDRGSEPRVELRLGAEAGQAFTSVMTMSMGMTMEVDGQPVPAPPLPDTRVTMEVTIDDVSDEGDISFSYRYAAVEPVAGDDIDPATLEAMKSAFTQLQGVTGTAVVSARGVALESKSDTSSVQDPNLRATVDSLNTQVEALTIPFPNEAVGKDATWQVTRQARLAGIDTEMKMRYRLTKLDGSTYTLDVEQEITAAPGRADVPGVPPGTKVTIDDYLVKTAGSIEGTLERILPTHSTLGGGGDIRMQVDSEGQVSTLVQHLDMQVVME